MRIHDEDSDRKLDRITLFLTNSEAEELRRDLGSLLRERGGGIILISPAMITRRKSQYASMTRVTLRASVTAQKG